MSNGTILMIEDDADIREAVRIDVYKRQSVICLMDR